MKNIYLLPTFTILYHVSQCPEVYEIFDDLTDSLYIDGRKWVKGIFVIERGQVAF